MKEELQGKLVEILTSIQTAAGKAGEFAMEQLPDIAQSYVMYGRAAATVYILCSLLLLGASVILFAKVLPKAISDDRPEKGGPAIVGGVFTAFGGIAVLLANMNSALLVWFAPKVWLLKEIATLLK